MSLFNFFNRNLKYFNKKNKDNIIQNNEISSYIRWQKIRNFLSVILLFIGLCFVFMTIAIYVMIEYREIFSKYLDF